MTRDLNGQVGDRNGRGDDNGDRSSNGRPNNNRTNNSNNSRPNSGSNSLFYTDLRLRLKKLSFTSFQNCVRLWLGAKGYRDIYVLRRSAARGRRPIGGADFIARSPYSPAIKVAIQVRHWQTRVQRRAVDELWGFMLRQGIPAGLIVTNNSFYPRATAAALEFPGRPIRLVSVSQLAGSLAALGLAVEPAGNGWVVSESFFRTLDRLRPASSLAASPGSVGVTLDSLPERAETLDSVSTIPPSQPQEPHKYWWLVLALVALLLLSWWLIIRSGR